MADAADVAQELEERERQALIARARRTAAFAGAPPRPARGFLDEAPAGPAKERRHVAR